VTRDEDRFLKLHWLRHQELSQFRLFRLLRLRRYGSAGPAKPKSPPDPPDDEPPKRQPQ
jgi:hypothetical protein